MREGSALLEILMRYGYCCSAQGPETNPLAARTSACGGACLGYAKPDYANMAHTFGVRYAYFDASFVEPPPVGAQPSNRNSVHVDATELAIASLQLLKLRGAQTETHSAAHFRAPATDPPPPYG